MNIYRRALILCAIFFFFVNSAAEKLPEDILKGRIIISDTTLPTKGNSAGEYANLLKKLHKSRFIFDNKTNKITLYYAGFFAQPVNDVQINLIIYKITKGNRIKKGEWEVFMGRKGERVVYNSATLVRHEIEINNKYLLALESAGKIIAQSEIILIGVAKK